MKFIRRLSWIAILAIISCGQKGAVQEPARAFPKNSPQVLNYETVSQLLQDMREYTKALRPLDTEAVHRVNDRYSEVFFTTQQKPLFVNVYADPSNGRVVFLIYPKDPKTGSTYLLNFDKPLPVVDSKTVEVQVRTQRPEEPLTCYLSVPDSTAYISEIQSHLFSVNLKLYKKFMQSGTFDFDGLTIESYRARGFPFIVFELARAELTDTTLNKSCECR